MTAQIDNEGGEAASQNGREEIPDKCAVAPTMNQQARGRAGIAPLDMEQWARRLEKVKRMLVHGVVG